MPRLKSAKRLQLEFFWRAHLNGWSDSDLNQRDYCGLHGLPLKRFGNWRTTFKDEERFVPEGLLWRRAAAGISLGLNLGVGKSLHACTQAPQLF